MSEPLQGRCGFVAIVGRPNVGKSTLLNHLIGQKISITSRKPQTTRQHILGVDTQGRDQIVYVDTPGLQHAPKRALNRYMNREVSAHLGDVDIILFLVEALRWTDADRNVLELLRSQQRPVILIVNKVDRLARKEDLLEYLDQRRADRDYHAIVPMSARNREDVAALRKLLLPGLPLAAHCFDADQLTDRNQRFLAAELVREKLMRLLGDELPYSTVVTVEDFTEDGGTLHIHATIWVERDGQKAIVIGKQGQMLKKIGTQARKDMQDLFGHKVNLQTWVKVRDKWSENARALQQFGYKS